MDVDLTEYNEPETVAKQFHEFLQTKCDADDAVLWSPSDNPYTDSWAVSWEQGPPDWAIHLSGGSSMFASVFPPGESIPDAEVTVWKDGEWIAEPYHSFDLQFNTADY